MQQIEVMAPAGSFDSLMAAIKAGAQSVYLGVGELNMRARASHNFTLEDLSEVVSICRKHRVKVYLTLNTVMYGADLPEMKKVCDKAKEVGVDAIIASDMSVINYAKSKGINIHISTQTNVSNIEAVDYFSQYADVVVLARELKLEQIRSISEEITKRDIRGPSGELIKIELFVHGALCMAISGKCYLSLNAHNSSANRGACLQNCRRKYRVIEEETGNELVLDNQYIMSPKDLCTIEFLDQIIDAGVSVLKLEGRGKPPEYVYTVTQCYREAVESIRTHSFSEEKRVDWMKRLQTVYNRDFWKGGYYLGKEIEMWSGDNGSQATKKKIYAGKVLNYFSNLKVGEILLEAHRIKKGDRVIITGESTGIVEFHVETLRSHTREKVDVGEKGEVVTLALPEKVRRNCKLYLMVDRKQP